MVKIIVSSAVLLLLIGAGASADIIQGQTLGVGTINDLHLQQSQQNGQSSQNVLVNMSQNTSEGSMGLVSAQIVGSSSQFGFSGLSGLGLLGGASTLSTHAQMLSLSTGMYMPVLISPLGSSSLLQGLVLLGH